MYSKFQSDRTFRNGAFNLGMGKAAHLSERLRTAQLTEVNRFI